MALTQLFFLTRGKINCRCTPNNHQRVYHSILRVCVRK